MPITIGILREEKSPPDKRVPFSPIQCKEIKQHFGVEIIVQPSAIRCFTDNEYLKDNITVAEDLSTCDIIMGVKEVPVQNLLNNKKYMFFSHTIKEQAHNKKLIKALLHNGIQMIDYETLTDSENNRVIGFGHYAGIVGTYNGLRAYGKRYNLYEIKPAHECHDKKELKQELDKINLPNIKIIVTGNGRVANGSIELLGMLGIRRITPFEFTHFAFRETTYCQLHSSNYNEPADGSAWNTKLFYEHPEMFRSTFMKYTKHCDLLVHCSFWNPKAPILFSKKEMRLPEFRISVIADVTCDIDGSIPSTVRASSISEPFYGYNPIDEKTEEPFANSAITVMAVDNLPCELPRDASEDFGRDLIDKVLPHLLSDTNDEMIERASITKNQKLMPRFQYLHHYATS
jgi:saccharopine dehydrogenase (NAD+, L-lysine forming)